MSEENFKERVRLTIINMAKLYKEKYVDYEYLICSQAFSERAYYIIDAKEDNFQHLTGVHTSLSAKDFFNKCYNGTLRDIDFDFIKKGQDEKSVKGTVRRKIKVLPDMMALFDNALLAEENFQKNKVICSFAAADSSCTLGFSESGKSRPKSLIKGNELKSAHPVELIIKKKAEEEFFNELMFGNESILYKYHEKIKSLIANELLKH